jgi:hypothetical protein
MARIRIRDDPTDFAAGLAAHPGRQEQLASQPARPSSASTGEQAQRTESILRRHADFHAAVVKRSGAPTILTLRCRVVDRGVGELQTPTARGST